MLPVLGGEGSKSAKGSSLINRIFGRQTSKDDADSPRNTTNRAGTGSLAAGTAGSGKQWVLEPRQAGAAMTTGVVKPVPAATNSKGSIESSNNLMDSGMFSAKSKKVLFSAAPANDSSNEGKVMNMLDHHHAFKRSHTVDDLGASIGSPRATSAKLKVTPVTTANAIANVGEKTKLGLGSPGASSPASGRRSPVPMIKAAAEAGMEGLDNKSEEEVKRMIRQLQQETIALRTELEVKKSTSGSGGSHRSPSIVVDFSEPKHQHRPSVMAQNLEQIKSAINSGSPRTSSRVSYAPEPMNLEEEDSGFIEDDADSKPRVKPANLYEAVQAEEKKKEEAAKKQKEREAAEAAAAAAAAIKQKQAEQQKPAAVIAQSSSAAKRKYKLLSVYPLLPPNMRRDEWSVGQFKIDKKLHAGYASEVYRAQDTVSKEIMAVKVYNLNALGELNKVQLIREIRLHGGFTHRNIVELFVSFQEEHRVILAQRFAEGGDLLRALHKAGGRLTEKSAVQMVIHPLLNCLVYLHSKGITHRDIKPENILFDGEGVLKLADFGLAINMTEEHAVTRAGTLHYMAPEVVKNPLKDHPNDFKNETRYHYNQVVDSWAVGCLAYELIVGFPPFMADTQQQVVKNINTLEIRYPKKMSEEMADFCKGALQRDPVHRATAAELMKHPWIQLHMRRNSSRQLNFEAQGGHGKVVADFAAGTALAKAANTAYRVADSGPTRSKEGSKMAPF